MHTWLLPPQCTHLLQPLDHVVFGNFKKTLLKHCNNLQDWNLHQFGRTKSVMMEAAYLAIAEVFTNRRLVVRSFAHCGIFPFNLSKIRAKVEAAPVEQSFAGRYGAEVAQQLSAAMSTAVSRVAPKGTKKVKGKFQEYKGYHSFELLQAHLEHNEEGMFSGCDSFSPPRTPFTVIFVSVW